LYASLSSLREAWKQIGDLIRNREASELKDTKAAFTREGPLQPELLITLLLFMVSDGNRRGYRHLLEAFWEEAKGQGLSLPTEDPVSAAAFCKVRQRLKGEAIRSLLREAVKVFDRNHGEAHRFHGRRCYAVDASKISLQRSPDLGKAFGGPPDSYVPQLMVTTLFDVMAKLPVDATISPYASSEREQLCFLVESLQPRDVVILDQGYPSYEVIECLISKGIDFVIRVPPVSSFPAVTTFVQSGGDDYRVVLCQTAEGKLVEVRAVRREGPDGKPQVFLTSLRRQEFSRSQILQLYGLRWEIELFFRLEKGSYLGHDQFHAKSPEGVRQEVFALLLLVALSRTFMAASATLTHVPYAHLSQKGALLAVSRCFTRLLLLQREDTARKLLLHLLERISKFPVKQRPGRSYPRRSFKPRPRWGAKGRT
jgi:hypothetical protein